jgi:hypothetical protein
VLSLDYPVYRIKNLLKNARTSIPVYTAS